MNLKDEKTKGAVAVVIIVASLLLFVVRMKRILMPPPVTGEVIAAAPAGAASVPPPAPGSVSAPPPGAPGVAGGTPAVPSAPEVAVSEVLPANPPKAAIKDPFALTAAYSKLIPEKGDGTKAAPAKGGTIPAPPKGTTLAFGFGKSGPAALPPMQLDSKPLARVEPLPVGGLPVGRAATESTPPASGAVASPAPPPAEVMPDIALTGTVDGDVPMAILRGNNRNYLVRVGDWLENSLKVHHITPREVELRDRSGRTRLLKLGVTENAS